MSLRSPGNKTLIETALVFGCCRWWLWLLALVQGDMWYFVIGYIFTLIFFVWLWFCGGTLLPVFLGNHRTFGEVRRRWWSCTEWRSGDRWQVTSDRWHLTCNTWNVTCNMWHKGFYSLDFLVLMVLVLSGGIPRQEISGLPYLEFFSLSFTILGLLSLTRRLQSAQIIQLLLMIHWIRPENLPLIYIKLLEFG